MDMKYIINADSKGKIKWVGINTQNGLEIVEIANTENQATYINELKKVNDMYGSDFFSAINNNNIKLASARFFEEEKMNQIKSTISAMPIEEKIKPVITAAPEEEKIQLTTTATPRIKKKSISKRAVALAAIITIAGASAVAYAHNENLQATVKNFFSKNNDKQTEESIEEADETEAIDLESKSLDELIDMLNDEEQKEAFNKIIDTQDYFNEVAAPTVKQGDKQLYFTFDETTAAYLYANAKAVSSDKLASFFGKSKIMVLNAETGEYEEMNKDLVSAEYLSFCHVLSYYYQLGATEKSGVDQLFENEKEAEFFREFEAKILEYNKTHSKKIAAEIRSELENIFMSGDVDSIINKYQGASSIIGTAIVPHLYLNGVIDKEMYKSLVEINETITCQEIYTQIEKIVNCKTKENGKEEIIEQIAKLQNERVINLDRNLSMEESLEGYRLSDLDQAVLGATPGFASSKTVTKHYRTITNNRSEAIKKTSAAQVIKAEQEANKKAGIEEKNQNENAYWDGFKAGYDKAYHDVWTGGSGNVSIPSGSAKYVEGYKAGVAAGIKYAKEDLKAAEKAKENYKPTPQPDEIESETFVPEENSNNNNNNNNDNSNNNNNNNSSTENTNSTPVAEPQEEIVEETFVYENNSTSSSSEAQRVVQVESHESNQKYEVTHESESEVRVRINP